MPTIRERVVNLTVAFGERALPPLERWLGNSSTVGDQPFFDNDTFPWARKLEADWRKIRAELDTVLEDQEHLPNFQDISVDQATMTTDDRWKTYFLYGYGFKSDANCARCPETARLCAEIPGMKTAFFSILAPGKHLPAHRGPYKGVMRYHLGLLIPEPADQCGIRVDTETRHWAEGASMIFDDTYEHEAWNKTDRTRVVLFVDFVRPLRAPARWLNAAVLWAIAFSPFIGDAKRRHNDWEKTFEAMKTRRASAA
ncbi:MAG TPA: aspartyl/asparaginyl beta-hydroxylase domain-containing protein [Solirubrobacteraceae bacterium]|nr:aspartyl/asparaginyl beta-hydroxylase domain-containing protein [Solirubrobacteraceae bacterium]